MGALSIQETEVDGKPTFEVRNAAGDVLAQRKSLKAAGSYVRKFEAEKQKLVGKRICAQRALRADCEPFFFIEPGGKGIDRDKFERLLSHDVIRPVGDALFPGMSQTYEPAE